MSLQKLVHRNGGHVKINLSGVRHGELRERTDMEKQTIKRSVNDRPYESVSNRVGGFK